MFSIEPVKKTNFPSGLYWPLQSYYHAWYLRDFSSFDTIKKHCIKTWKNLLNIVTWKSRFSAILCRMAETGISHCNLCKQISYFLKVLWDLFCDLRDLYMLFSSDIMKNLTYHVVYGHSYMQTIYIILCIFYSHCLLCTHLHRLMKRIYIYYINIRFLLN